jgi:hypothetical protein
MNALELRAGYKAFQAHEKRDAMYNTATRLITNSWGNTAEMADGLGVLLLTWNQAFYRYGIFDFEVLEECIANNLPVLNAYRKRDILSYSTADDSQITNLYLQFLEATQIADGKSAGKQSPVSVSKGLHLLAPAFFPLWDDKIARAYKCRYKYIPFMREMKTLAQILVPNVDAAITGKTLLKLIDEYNYAKFTKEWI